MYWKHKLWHIPCHFQAGPAKHIHVWPPVAIQSLCAPLPSTNSWWIPEVSLPRVEPKEEKKIGRGPVWNRKWIETIWSHMMKAKLGKSSRQPLPTPRDIWFSLKEKKNKTAAKKRKESFNRGKKLVDTSELQMVCVPKQTVCLLLTQAKQRRPIWWCWRNLLPH